MKALALALLLPSVAFGLDDQYSAKEEVMESAREFVARPAERKLIVEVGIDLVQRQRHDAAVMAELATDLMGWIAADGASDRRECFKARP